MSDANGQPAPLPPPDTRGAVNLQAAILAKRVKEIAEATIKRPLPAAPVVREDVVINQTGDASLLDVDFVIDHVNAKRWQIMAKLGILGIDPAVGEWSLVEVGYGEDAQRRLVAHFVLTWSLPGAVEKKSPLEIVK